MEAVLRKEFDFPVAKVPLFTKEGVEVKSKAIIRTDTQKAISVVSPTYEVFEHKKVLDFIDPYIKKFGTPSFDSVVEKEGARALFRFTFKDNLIHIGDKKLNDLVAMRITVVNSYDSSTSLQFNIGGLRLVCMNGAMTSKGNFDVTFRHTKKIWELDLPNPEIVLDAFKNEGKLWTDYQNTPLNYRKREEVIDEGLKLSIISKKAFNEALGQFNASANYWDLFNAFTYALTHYSPRVADSAKISRLNRLNALFRVSTRDVTPKAEPGQE